MKKHLKIVGLLGILHVLFFWSINLKSLITTHSMPLHLNCLKKSASFQTIQSQEIFNAIVCGKNLTIGSEALQAFINLGLIHILVVSGSHFSTLQNLILKLVGNRPVLLMLLLFVYSAMTLFQPPGGRAFVSFLLFAIDSRFRLSRNKAQLEIFSGLVCLCVFPDWITSLSFHLSWSLSLLLSLLSNTKKETLTSHFLKLICIQFTAGLLIGSFGQLSILANLILAPIFSIFLFPFGLLVLLTPHQVPIFSQAWDFLIPLAMKPLFALGENSKIVEMPLTWPSQWFATLSLLLIFALSMKLSLAGQKK